MKNTRRLAAHAIVSIPVLAAAAALAVVACSGDDPAPAAANDDAGSTTPTPTPTPTPPPAGQDAGDDAGTEAITDGGANLDPDAGGDLDASVPPDSGVILDGGIRACNATTTAAAVNTTCASFTKIPAGGKLVGGTYDLVGVAVLAAPTFCSTSFVSASVSGGMVLKVDANGVGTAERATKFGAALLPQRRTETLTPGAKGAITIDTSCPIGISQLATTYDAYSVQPDPKVRAEQHIVIKLPYGKGGSALYHYKN
jgi:hypothetical protein